MSEYAIGDLVAIRNGSDIAGPGGVELTGYAIPRGTVGIVKIGPETFRRVSTDEPVEGYYVSFPEAPADWFIGDGKMLGVPACELVPAKEYRS